MSADRSRNGGGVHVLASVPMCLLGDMDTDYRLKSMPYLRYPRPHVYFLMRIYTRAHHTRAHIRARDHARGDVGTWTRGHGTEARQ
jgi:hypothetical protein